MFELISFPLYLSVKAVAYIGWCIIGVMALRGLDFSSSFGKGLVFGILRLMIGFGFGWAIWVGGSMVDMAVKSSVVTYILVYVPIRWIEWGIIEKIIDRNTLFFVGVSKKHRLWRMGGIVISCAADIPLILSVGGLMVGRFLC